MPVDGLRLIVYLTGEGWTGGGPFGGMVGKERRGGTPCQHGRAVLANGWNRRGGDLY